MTDTPELRIVHTRQEFAALKSAWANLVDQNERPAPMLTPTWLLNWWDHYGANRKLAVGVFHGGERLLGLAPMCSRRYHYVPGLAFRRLEWLGAGSDEVDAVCSEYLNLIAKPGDADVVATMFVRALADNRLGRWDEVILEAMEADHPLRVHLEEACRTFGWRMESTATEVASFAALPESWDEYLRALDKKKRKTINQSLRDFRAWAGDEFHFHRADSNESRQTGWSILKKLHEERWRSRNQPGVFSSARFEAMHDAVTRALLPEGQLDLTWLTVRGQPVAVQYTVLHAGKAFFYQCGRKIDGPENVRVGIVGIIFMLQGLIERGIREFDFLGGEGQHKSLFAPERRPLVSLRIVRPGWKDKILRTLRWGVRKARNLVRPRAAQGEPVNQTIQEL